MLNNQFDYSYDCITDLIVDLPNCSLNPIMKEIENLQKNEQVLYVICR